VATVSRPTAAGRPRDRAGWGSSLWALLSGSLLALLLLLPVGLGLDALHLLGLGLGTQTTGGFGWPWRIVGVWSAAADLAPHLAVATLLAVTIGHYLPDRSDGQLSARWPIGLCALVFGWPINRGGYLGASIGLALVAMWIVTRLASGMPRPRFRFTPLISAAVAVGGCGLTMASIAYGALYPVTAAYEPASLSIGAAQGSALMLALKDSGPLPIHVLGLSLEDPAGVSVSRQTQGETHGVAGLDGPVRSVRIAPGASAQLFGVLRVRRGAQGFESLSAVRVRYAVAGTVNRETVLFAHPILVKLSTVTSRSG
jgi:hypothetical protein